jgi:hypothetical protein
MKQKFYEDPKLKTVSEIFTILQLRGRRYSIGLSVYLVAIFWSIPSHAITVAIDQFTITQGATSVLNDTFSDGVPPPSGPNGANTYIVQGTFPAGAESGDLLQLNSANGVLTANALETPRLTLVVENRHKVQ